MQIVASQNFSVNNRVMVADNYSASQHEVHHIRFHTSSLRGLLLKEMNDFHFHVFIVFRQLE